MISSDWPSCVITAFDMIATRRLAAEGCGSSQMIQMRKFAVEKINKCLPMHSHGYVWNDSILLLSYDSKTAERYQELLVELSEFKSSLESNCGVRTYAICVKGLAFPTDDLSCPVFEGQISDQPRAVVLKTSSWAMANCFVIENQLKRHLADWYIDSRITSNTNLPQPFASENVELLPKGESRSIQMYKGFFHGLG